LAILTGVIAAIFITAHLLFLWVLFSGTWSARTGGVLGFFRHALVQEGLWLPLLILFVARGAVPLILVLRRLFPHAGLRTLRAAPPTTDALLAGLFKRIVLMQVAIIIGAWFIISAGARAPLILLVLGKALAEWALGSDRPALKPATIIR
jgi:hypothetical protein